MAKDTTTLKDLHKELKEQNKKNDALVREAGKFRNATKMSGGFLSTLAERTKGVPLLGNAFGSITETIEKVQDGIDATAKLLGKDSAMNKIGAEIAAMSVKDYKETQEANEIAKAKAATEDALFKALADDADLQGFYNELTDGQKRAIAANDKGMIDLLKAAKAGDPIHLTGLLEEVVKNGEETIKLEEKAREDKADEARERGKRDLTMLERLKELGSGLKDKMGLTGEEGEGGEAKGAGGFISNMMGDFFGGLSAVFLGNKMKGLNIKEGMKWMGNTITSGFTKLKDLGSKMVTPIKAYATQSAKWIGGVVTSGFTKLKMLTGKMVAPVKAFAMMAGKWLVGLMSRAIAFMNPYVLIALAVVGILVYFKDDIINWFKNMWSAITGFFENISWGDMFKTVLKVIFLPHILIFKLGKMIWGAITGFFEGFSLEGMMSKLKDLSIVKYIIDLKDKIVNGFKAFILKIVPETFFKYPLRAKVAKMLGVTLPGGSGTGDEEIVEEGVAPTASTKNHVADKSADVFDPKFAERLNQNALAKTESKGATNIVSSTGGNVVTTNQSVTHQSTSIGNKDPVYSKFLYAT